MMIYDYQDRPHYNLCLLHKLILIIIQSVLFAEEVTIYKILIKCLHNASKLIALKIVKFTKVKTSVSFADKDFIWRVQIVYQ